MRNILLVALVVGLFLSLGAATARADQVIFSNLASTPPLYNPTDEFEADTFNSSAFSFTIAPSSSFNLTQIDIALTFVAFAPGGTNDGAKVELLNSAGNIPGTTVLGTWNVGALPATFSTDSILQTISGISGVVLNGGTTYWLAALPADATAFNQWQFNNTSDLIASGNAAGTSDVGSTWLSAAAEAGTPRGAFDVRGNPVLEPSSLLLLGTGLLGLGLVARRRVRFV